LYEDCAEKRGRSALENGPGELHKRAEVEEEDASQKQCRVAFQGVGQ
jgi:hypothetical protein